MQGVFSRGFDEGVGRSLGKPRMPIVHFGFRNGTYGLISLSNQMSAAIARGPIEFLAGPRFICKRSGHCTPKPTPAPLVRPNFDESSVQSKTEYLSYNINGRLSTSLLVPQKPSVADHSHSIACVRKMVRAGPAHKHKRGTKSPASFGCAQMVPPKPRAQILGITEHLC